MTEKSTGITVKNPTEYIATFEASEQAEGHTRLVQIISLSSGKISETIGVPDRTANSNDSLDVTTVTGTALLGDNNSLIIYTQHSQPAGSCVVTPLICDNDGTVLGCLSPTQVSATLTLQSGTGFYIGNIANWEIKGCGGWKCYPHISNLSSSNQIKLWVYAV